MTANTQFGLLVLDDLMDPLVAQPDDRGYGTQAHGVGGLADRCVAFFPSFGVALDGAVESGGGVHKLQSSLLDNRLEK